MTKYFSKKINNYIINNQQLRYTRTTPRLSSVLATQDANIMIIIY